MASKKYIDLQVDKSAVEELGLFLQTLPSETQALWNGTAALVGRLSSDNNSIQIQSFKSYFEKCFHGQSHQPLPLGFLVVPVANH